MARRNGPTGLVRRGAIWHIEKRAKWLPGGRLCESTGKTARDEAERYLTTRLEQLHRLREQGPRRERTFDEAAAQYLREHAHLSTILEIAAILERLMPYIGHLTLRQVHRESLQPWVQDCLAAGRRPKTINNGLAVVRRITNLSARLWRDDHGRPWLDVPPLIPPLPVLSPATPYPLDWTEQRMLFRHLPAHLARPALFKVNVGCREQEVCGLRWAWERRVNGRSVFLLPREATKSKRERLVVLNAAAQAVIEAARGQHPDRVFVTRSGGPLAKIYGREWRRAWADAGLPQGRDVKRGVHNLRHTFGRRLRAAGVSLETRRALLGHSMSDLTTHYSAAEVEELQRAVDLLVESETGTVLRLVAGR